MDPFALSNIIYFIFYVTVFWIDSKTLERIYHVNNFINRSQAASWI